MKFDPLIEWNADKTEAKCKLCSHPMKKQVNNGTAGFKYHFENKHKKEDVEAALMHVIPSKNKDQNDAKAAKRALVDQMNTWQEDGISSKELDETIAMAIAIDGLPMNVTEKLGFNFLLHKLRPNYKPKKRTTMTSSILPNLFTKYKNMLRAELKLAKSVAIGADIWSDEGAKHEVLGVSCVFMMNEKPVLRLLSAHSMETRHTGENIKNMLTSILLEFDIESKVVGFVRDGASNMINAGNLLNVPHYDCLLHKVSLAARASVAENAEVMAVVTKMKKCARKLMKSPLERKTFETCQELLDLPVYSLKKSIDIRWLSVYDMAERFLKVKEALLNYQKAAPTDFPQLTEEDFGLVEVIVENLKPLKVAIMRAQKTFFPASAIVPFLMSLIKKLEPTPVSRCADMLTASSEKLRAELEKYMKIDTILMATAVDPRFKLSLLDKTVEASLLKKMTEISGATSDDNDDAEVIETESQEDELFSGIFPVEISNLKIRNSEKNQTPVKELENWKSIQHSTSENPFSFWEKGENQKLFPNIYSIAKSLLTLPASSVDTERAFSSARHILTDYRKQMSPANFSMLLFLNQNLPKMCPHFQSI